MTSENSRGPREFRDQGGQGLIEYLVIVALMAVATIGIVRALSQTVSAKFASATYALQGSRKSAKADSVDESLYKKKDLSNFINGAGKGEGGEKASGGANESDNDRDL